MNLTLPIRALRRGCSLRGSVFRNKAKSFRRRCPLEPFETEGCIGRALLCLQIALTKPNSELARNALRL
jgi:hypothetical protein